MKLRKGNTSVKIFWEDRIMFRCSFYNSVMLDTPSIKEAFLFFVKNY